VSAIGVEERRAHYPALANGFVYLDGPGGTQVSSAVIEAVSRGLTDSMSNVGGFFASSLMSTDSVKGARAAVADLLGADPPDVALGTSMTALTYQVADGLSGSWLPGDEVVVTRLDHDANVRPWVQAAERSGATVRWIDIRLPECEIALEDVVSAITPRTRLVAMTAASNVVGSRPEVAEVAEIAHAHDALLYVDAVHAAQHCPVSLSNLKADFVACSAYKLFGPHVAAVAAAPTLLDRVNPRRLAPAPETAPGSFDTGTLPFELLHGLIAAIDHLAALSPIAGSRRERLAAAMAANERYCENLFCTMRDGLSAIDHVEIIGAPRDRVATIAFRIRGQSPAAVAAALADQGFCVGHGNFYAYELARRLGVYETGGVVRAAVLHYNTEAEIISFLAAVEEVARRSASVGAH
jgi:cysteine desulfurase family protein (TIGR01976 family)